MRRQRHPAVHARRALGAATAAAFLVLGNPVSGAGPATDDEVVLVRLKYTVDASYPGRQNDWNAKAFGKVLYNVSAVLNEATAVTVAPDPTVVTLGDPELFSHPFLFMVGHFGCTLNDTEVENLRKHLAKGGFLLATACCGNESFARSFEREMRKVFPEKTIEILPAEHPVYSVFYPIRGVTCYTGSDESNESVERMPLRGIDIDGRTAVIFSPYALTCGWTRRSHCIASCRRVATEDAFKLAANIVLYALTH